MILCLGTTPTVQRTMIFQTLKIDEVNRAQEVWEYASGKSINVARVVRTLGEQAAVCGFAGGDRGKFLRQEIEEAGVEDWLIESHRQTRLCTTVIDENAGTATELIQEAEAVEPEAWEALEELLSRQAAQAKVIVCSGSLAPGGQADFYARRVAEKKPGQIVIIDGRGEVVREALKYPGFVLKLNREELAATVGEELPLEEMIKRATPRDGAIVTTMGKQGAMARQGQRTWHIATPAVQTISPIGSGDAFAAGLAVALSRGQSFVEACKLGAACGAANAMTPRAGEVRLEAVRELEKSVELRMPNVE